ncbi:hypothetical protein [Parasitella parasitica]|uniref:HSF-type DNA-binding domain-containing protein n=1 Tax=Parasitella parasitica TaxID=35722 RepID=A0A0B7N6M3_9FUNG|nr:hypothetical protein [Parasitella parasitica]
MNQVPIAIKEEEKEETPKMFKSIAPSTAVTTTKSQTASSSSSSHAPPLQKNVPAFLNKLYSMVNDPESDDLICWSDDGASFFVNRQEDFARKVLPRFFKHNKFSSFVRQLNMYGFHKVPHLQQGVLETDSESERWEFSNPHFQRNQPDLLLLVTRKKGPSTTDDKEISNIDLQHILEEIQSIKKHQMNISTQLQGIQRDNQVLWQETVSARERHLRHQETIDKILRFLASVFSNGEKRPAIPRKRRFLLGPADGDDHEAELDLYDLQHQKQQQQPQQSHDTARPKKMPRQDHLAQQTQPSPSTAEPFDFDDYVSGKNDLAGLSASLPAHIKSSAASTPSSDLADAIALNDHSKNVENSPLTAINDFSNITNIPQLQNLQSLISLAQSNPHLLSQLTSDAFYGMPPSPPTTTNPQHLTSVPAIATDTSPSSSTAASSVASMNLTSSSPASSAITTPSQLQLQQQLQQQQSTRSLNQVTNSLSSIAGSADALNQDIDDLGLSLQALAQHLGFDPAKMNAPMSSQDMDIDHQKLDDAAEGELLDMDEFLNTFGSDVVHDNNDPAAQDFSSPTITPFTSATNTRSPSPATAVTTATQK